MICVFTSIISGGILQLANQVADTLLKLNYDFKLFIPNCSVDRCSGELKDHIIGYNVTKSVIATKEIKVLAKSIETMQPELFISVDDALFSELVFENISAKIKKFIFVHDVTPHPSVFSLRSILVEKMRGYHRKRSFAVANRVVLLSQHSQNSFKQKYKHFYNKSVVLPLGAHIIPAEKVMPSELKNINHKNFMMFFGRIDKYKGVENLINSYNLLSLKEKIDSDLVIAGSCVSGYKLCDVKNPQIHVINRYIKDGEMQWLFENCKLVLLPYTEASQSGVLPMAYKYGKPVLASNIPGLKELVINDVTGKLFSSNAELFNLIKEFSMNTFDFISQEKIIHYYNENYDWIQNIKYLIDLIIDK